MCMCIKLSTNKNNMLSFYSQVFVAINWFNLCLFIILLIVLLISFWLLSSWTVIDFSNFFQYRIQVTLPKTSLILGMWWSTPAFDLNNGYIVRFGKIYHSAPAVMGSGSYTTLLDASYNRARNLATTDVTLTTLPQPILTSQVTFGDIVFTASPLGSEPQWNFGHVIPFNLELYGCDNYQMDESKRCLQPTP